VNVKVIVNPAAGNGRAKDIIPQIENFLYRKDVSFNIETTYRPGGGTLLAKRAIATGFELIIAVGGNGTVAEVVNGIIGSDAILGIIPAGTGNDIAKMLGIPENIEEACEIALSPTKKKIDLGLINSRYFINGVGIGLDAQIAKNVRGTNTYKRSFLKTLFTSKPININMNVDGVAISKPVTSMTISNSKSFWGDHIVSPDALIDDGKLDICMTDSVSRLKYFINFKKASKGEHSKVPFITTMQGRKINLNIPKSSPIHVDGELFESEDQSYNIELWSQILWVKSKPNTQDLTVN